MRITLTYQGPLPGRRQRVTEVKHELRKAFHPQLVAQVAPLLGPKSLPIVTSEVDGHRFVSVAHRAFRTAVELEVLLLSPPGVKPAGDTDNRLKTLIDGLTRPANAEQMRGHAPPEDGPMFCLMDDDALVTRLSVDSRRWYGAAPGDSEALVVVTAQVVRGENADMDSPFGNLFVLI